MKVTCGPVVGLVNRDSARILLEVDRECTVTMTLQDKQGNEIQNIRIDLPRKVPRVFQFKDLEPDKRYVIYLPDIDTGPHGRFRTLPSDPQKINIGVVSCDYPERKTYKNMWQHLYTKGKKEKLHLILHIGDNVYMDGDVSEELTNKEFVRNSGIFNPRKVDQELPYVRARSMIQELDEQGQQAWESKREEILELYRDRYRVTWGREYTAKVLSHFANLMILDDHEIRDDFGTLEDDGTPGSVEYWLGTLALQVYHEYQRQLWDPNILDAEAKQPLVNEFYSIKLGPLGIAMMDARTPNSVYKPQRSPDDRSYYGREQMTDLVDILEPDLRGNTRMWLICCALPLLFFKKKVIEVLQIIDKKNDDLDVFIDRNKSELVPIWNAVRKWKEASGPAGDILVLAGDVHLGGFTDIFHPGKNGRQDLVCHQITTSPIHNKNMKTASYAIGKLLLESCSGSCDDYTYQHYDWVNGCNYLIVKLDFSAEDQVRYSIDLVPEKGEIFHKDSVQAAWNTGTSFVDWFKRFICVK